MKENSPICDRLAETLTAVVNGNRKSSTMAKAASDFPTTISMTRQHDMHRLAPQDRGIEQHADGDEEQDREGVLERQRIGRGAVAEARFAQDDAGEEGAEREGNAETDRRAVGDAEREGQNRQREELARTGARHLGQEPRHDAGAEKRRKRDEAARPWRS